MTKLRNYSPRLYHAVLWALINIPLGVITITLLACGYMLWWPVEPKITLAKSHIETPIVSPYGPLIIHRLYNIKAPIVATISRQIKQKNGTAIFFLPSVTRTFDAQENDAQPYIPLPGLPPGQYLYHATVTYHENILREVVLITDPHEFTVRQP